MSAVDSLLTVVSQHQRLVPPSERESEGQGESGAKYASKQACSSATISGRFRNRLETVQGTFVVQVAMTNRCIQIDRSGGRGTRSADLCNVVLAKC